MDCEQRKKLRETYGHKEIDLVPLVYKEDPSRHNGGELVDSRGNKVNAKPISRGLFSIKFVGDNGDEHISSCEIISQLEEYLLSDYPENKFPNPDLMGKVGFIEGFASYNPKTIHTAPSWGIPIQLYKIEDSEPAPNSINTEN